MLNLDMRPHFPCVLIFLAFTSLVFANKVPVFPSSTENLPVLVTNPSVCNLGLVINDQSCPNNNILEVDIDVINAPGTMLGTNVFLKELRVIFAHDWTADLDIYLVAPNGTRVEISTDNGSAGDNYGIPNGVCDSVTTFISTIYDDGCSTPSIKAGIAPFVGTFLPEGDFNDFNDGQNPNGIWRLEACDDGQFNVGKLEFIELVFEASGCLAPTDIVANNVAANSVNLTWQSNVANPVDTIFEYGPVGFTIGQGMTAQTNPIQGLQPSTTYEIYVQEACSAGVFTTNSCPITVTTICTPPNPTLSENFNNQDLCSTLSNCNLDCDLTGLWNNVSNDQMNWLVRQGTTPTGFTGPSDDVEGGGQYLYLETSGFGCAEDDEAVLLSNLIAIDTIEGVCEMSFNYHLYGQHINTLTLEITTDCGDTWTELFSAIGEKGDQWLTAFIDLDDYDDMDAQFRFRGSKGTSFRGDMAIDNLNFFGPQLSNNQIFTFYFDNDDDEFGDDGNFITTCNPIPPAGYILQNGDCDDNDEFINPGMMEIPCNFIDDNCNGIGDEVMVEFPQVVPTEICEGETATLQAFADNPDAEIWWYENENDFFPVHQGEFFSPEEVPDIQVNTITVLTYYVTTFVPPICFNDEKTPVTITIYPNPELVSQPVPDVCMGTNLQLLDYADDEKATDGTWFCFGENGAAIPNCSVMVSQSETFKIQKLSEGACSDSIFISVNVLASPIAQISGDSTLCSGDFAFLNGSNIGNGTVPLSYQWNTGNTGANQQIFSSSTPNATNLYTLTIMGQNGCVDTDSFTVTTVQSIENVTITKQNVTACNGMDGILTVEISGGVPPFIINWNGATTGQMTTNEAIFSLENLPQGAYSFNISDSSNSSCNVHTPLMIINGPGAVVSTPNITPVSCADEEDGCISIAVSGTNPTIVWSNGSQNDTICNLATGYYSVTVFDGNCTTEVDSIFVPQPFPLTAFANRTNISCAGETNGIISINVNGGTAPFTYLWEDNSTLPTRNNLAAGNYSATVTDAKDCIIILDNIEITEPLPLFFIEEINHPSCFNSSNGSIALTTVGGGVPPYQVQWSNGVQGFNNNFLQDGFYQFTITDSENCSLTSTSQIIEPQQITIDIFKNDATCNGIADGSINLVVNGGTPPILIEWIHGPTGNLIENLAHGYYRAFITDANSCSILTDSIYIDAPELLNFSTPTTPSFCDGINDGTVKIIINDGIDYDFSWGFDPSVTDSCLTNLAAGDYSLTITSPNQCQVETTINVPTTERIFVNSQVLSSACVGSQSGAISLNISGENPLFFVEWSNGESMFANEQAGINNLSPGIYAATITDDLGCVKQLDSLFIDENPAIEIIEESTVHNTCFGQELGSIAVSILGGSGIYSTNWSNGISETMNNENLLAGEYMLTVTDDNGCVVISPVFEIFQPDSFQILTNLIDANECTNNLMDSLCVSVIGSTAPYSYEWSTGASTPCLLDQPTGEYDITVTDANACEGIVEGIKIPDPIEDLDVAFQPNDTLFLACPDSEGQFTIGINGGASPYQILWSHGQIDTTHQNSLTANGLDAGACNVTVTDNRGCVAVSDSFYVFRPDSIDILITEVEEVGCKGGRNGEIHLQVTGGTHPYSFEWYNENEILWGTEQSLTDTVEAGFYTIEIRDANNCFSTFQNIEVIEPDSILNIFPILSRDTICFGDQNGFINITPSGGYPPYSFNWGNGATTADIFNLAAGSYGLTVTDDGGCNFILPPYFIHQSAAPITLENSTVTDVDCFGNQNGMIDVTFSGGWQPLEYEWITSETLPDPNNPTLNGLSGGTYPLFVTDAQGCFFDDLTFTVNEPAELITNVDISAPNYNEMLADVELISMGGTAPYSYLWEDGHTDVFRESLPFGNYVVTVTDANNCEEIIEFLLDATTNTEDLEEVNGLNLFPNPTTGEVYLEIDLTKPVNFSLEIFDLLGKRVLSRQNSQQASETLPMDLQHLPSGTYFVKLLINQNVIPTKKLILMD